MPRAYRPAPMEYDEASGLMSDLAVMKFLGTGERGIELLIREKKLHRHPITGSFARAEVERLAKEIERAILAQDADGTEMGREEPPMGVFGGVGKKPTMVPLAR